MMASSPAAPLFRERVNIKVTQDLFYSQAPQFPFAVLEGPKQQRFLPIFAPSVASSAMTRFFISSQNN